MSSGIYKDLESRRAYQRKYHAEMRKKQTDSKEYVIRKCIRSVKGLRKEIGDYNCNRVIECLESVYRSLTENT